MLKFITMFFGGWLTGNSVTLLVLNYTELPVLADHYNYLFGTSLVLSIGLLILMLVEIGGKRSGIE